jgi:hypothetical protein
MIRTSPVICSLAGAPSVSIVLFSKIVAWLETPALSTQQVPLQLAVPI